MNPVPVEAEKSIKNAVENKSTLRGKWIMTYPYERIFKFNRLQTTKVF